MTAVIALTGGIASGKTTVSDRFAELGVPVIDTDVIAHELVAPGQPLLYTLKRRFGREILLPNGGLDRRQLRKRVFSNAADRDALEAILHPAILEKAHERIDHSSGTYCVVVIPLLAENKVHEWIDRVLVVDCPEHLQLERLLKRDFETRAQAEAIIASQASRKERLAIADDVIVNDGTLKDLLDATDRQHISYQKHFSEGGP